MVTLTGNVTTPLTPVSHTYRMSPGVTFTVPVLSSLGTRTHTQTEGNLSGSRRLATTNNEGGTSKNLNGSPLTKTKQEISFGKV